MYGHHEPGRCAGRWPIPLRESVPVRIGRHRPLRSQTSKSWLSGHQTSKRGMSGSQTTKHEGRAVHSSDVDRFPSEMTTKIRLDSLRIGGRDTPASPSFPFTTVSVAIEVPRQSRQSGRKLLHRSIRKLLHSSVRKLLHSSASQYDGDSEDHCPYGPRERSTSMAIGRLLKLGSRRLRAIAILGVALRELLTGRRRRGALLVVAAVLSWKFLTVAILADLLMNRFRNSARGES